MKKILICTANYYTSKYQVGIHNYARAFAKLGYKVAFISDPISPLHAIFSEKETYNARKHISKKKGDIEGNIWFYVPESYITPQNKFILSSKYIFENWYKYCKASFLDLLKEKGFNDVDILWIESPLYGFLLDKIKYKKSILRLADYSKGFNDSWELFYRKEIEIANKVDRVIYTAKILYDLYNEIQNKNKMVYIPNGIDLDWIRNADISLPMEFLKIAEPRVIYIGMIDDWFDVDLVYDSALKLKNYNFIFIGNSNIDLSRLKKLDNIYILGLKPHNQISKYLYHSDIGIIPFKRNTFVDAINPIKIYEYAAFNLKVVSTYWKEVEGLKEYFFICKNREEFMRALSYPNNQDKDKVYKWLIKQDWKNKVLEAIKF